MYNLTKLDLLWKWVDELKKTVADNVKHLLPDTSTATTGQILKLTGESKTPSWGDEYSYTPPAFSTTETATGQKWIDGKDVYCKVVTGTFPEITSTQNIDLTGFNYIDTLISIDIYLKRTEGLAKSVNRFTSSLSITGVLTVTNVSTTYSECTYNIVLYYTKPTPGRAPEDQEPEEKKTTKKKTTK